MLGLLPLAGGYRGKRSRREADWIRQEAGPERQQKGLRTRVGWELVTECGWEDASGYGRWRSAATCPDHQGGLRLTVFVSPHNGPLHVMSPTRTQASEAQKEQAGAWGSPPGSQALPGAWEPGAGLCLVWPTRALPPSRPGLRGGLLPALGDGPPVQTSQNRLPALEIFLSRSCSAQFSRAGTSCPAGHDCLPVSAAGPAAAARHTMIYWSWTALPRPAHPGSCRPLSRGIWINHACQASCPLASAVEQTHWGRWGEVPAGADPASGALPLTRRRGQAFWPIHTELPTLILIFLSPVLDAQWAQSR